MPKSSSNGIGVLYSAAEAELMIPALKSCCPPGYTIGYKVVNEWLWTIPEYDRALTITTVNENPAHRRTTEVSSLCGMWRSIAVKPMARLVLQLDHLDPFEKIVTHARLYCDI